jgi:hypothetical protein
VVLICGRSFSFVAFDVQKPAGVAKQHAFHDSIAKRGQNRAQIFRPPARFFKILLAQN